MNLAGCSRRRKIALIQDSSDVVADLFTLPLSGGTSIRRNDEVLYSKGPVKVTRPY